MTVNDDLEEKNLNAVKNKSGISCIKICVAAKSQGRRGLTVLWDCSLTPLLI